MSLDLREHTAVRGCRGFGVLLVRAVDELGAPWTAVTGSGWGGPR